MTTGNRKVLNAEPVRLAALATPIPDARRSVGNSSGTYTYTRFEAAEIGFDDEFIYKEVPLAPEVRSIPGVHLRTPESHIPFAEWAAKPDKICY